MYKPVRFSQIRMTVIIIIIISVGIDLKELGGQMSKCLKFCTGIEILNRFSLKNERL